jgi:ribonuclease HII
VFLASKDASDIDRVGIREANKSCMNEVIMEAEKHLNPEDTIEVYIDGCDNFTFETLTGYTYTFAKK